jgi:predicted nucleic acid-binding protein
VIYLDSSAIVKLVAPEPETPELVEAIRLDPVAVSCALAWTEVVRAVRRSGGAIPRARRVLDGIALAPIDEGILRGAAELAPRLRTLDAIHLGTALSLREEIASFVTYDDRLAAATAAAGLAVSAPGRK